MSFLIPQILWALPAIALPLVFHLFSQINTKTVEFSALRFLKAMEHESIKRLRWHQWLIILIRTLIILFLILVLSRPVMQGYYQGLGSEGASTLSVVVVDDSFSMRGKKLGPGRTERIDHQLTQLIDVLSRQSDQAQVIIIRASDARLIYDGEASNLPSVRALSGLIGSEFAPDQLPAVMDTLSGDRFQSRAALFANRELIILSDFQNHQSNLLRHWASDTTIWGNWQMLLMPIGASGRNAAVTAARVTTAIPIIGELMDVEVTITNTGTDALIGHPVQIVLNGVRAGQLVVNLDSREEQTVVFQVAPNKPGPQEGYAEVEPDDRGGDNRFYFYAYIPSRVKILLLDSFGQSPAYGHFALKSLEAASSQIEMDRLPYTEVNWSVDDYDVVILNGIQSLPRLLPRRINDFLETGGHLVMIPGASGASAQALGLLQQALGLTAISREPELLGAPLQLESESAATSFLANVLSRELGQQDGPAFSAVYPFSAGAKDEVILRLSSGHPILARASLLGGYAFTLTTPLDLGWTDLPLKGSYIPFWHLLVSWMPTETALADIRIGQSPELPVTPRQATQPVLIEGPGNIRSRLIPDLQRRIVMLRDLRTPGIYLTKFGDNSTGLIEFEIRFPVNISSAELSPNRLSIPDLRTIMGTDRAFIYAPSSEVDQWLAQARFGRELWRGLLYALVILIIIETLLANAYSTPRRKS